MYSVKQAAEILHLTEHTIRYYTDQGLVPHMKRDKNNNRIFDEASLKWLECAKHLRKCGMSVADIKTYVNLCLEGDSTTQERYDIFMKQKHIAQVQLEEAKERATYIEEKTEAYLDILQGVDSDDMNTVNKQAEPFK